MNIETGKRHDHHLKFYERGRERERERERETTTTIFCKIFFEFIDTLTKTHVWVVQF